MHRSIIPTLVSACFLVLFCAARFPAIAGESADAAQDKTSPARLAGAALQDLVNNNEPVAALYAITGFVQDFPGDGRAAIFLQLLPVLANSEKLSGPQKEAFMQLWQMRCENLLADIGLTDEIRVRVRSVDITRERILQQRAARPNLAILRSKIDELTALWPQTPALQEHEIAYAELLRKSDPAAAAAHLGKLTSSPNQRVAEAARGKIELYAAFVTPVELRFTAVDGREVDLAKLRNKVVLIDFWATWCGPCIDELPNIQAVYDKYHNKGLEVIGISLDKAEDKQKLIDFVAKENIPWPQYYDGKYMKTEVAAKYGISAIPALFLLDRGGRMASVNARGPKLEEEIKKLMGL